MSSASFATGGIFEDEPSTGVRMAGIGAAFWAVVLCAGWLLPKTSLGRAGRVLVVASTASMLTVLGGIGLITISVLL